MGFKKIMKKLILIFLLINIFVIADISLLEIENIIKSIEKKRKGMTVDTLAKTKEPFLKVIEDNNISIINSHKKNVKKENIILHAIINEKAYINNSWKKINDTVLGYKVDYIGNNMVILKKGKRIKKLFFIKKRSVLFF